MDTVCKYKDFVKDNPKYKIGNKVTFLRTSLKEEEHEFCDCNTGNPYSSIGKVLTIENNDYRTARYNDRFHNLIKCDGWWHSICSFEHPEVLRKQYRKYKIELKIPKWKKIWRDQ